MKKLIVAIGIVCMLGISAVAFAKDVYVQGYYRSNGTYVQPYHRSSPNSTTDDNYGTKGNINPFTGQPGTIAPPSPFGTDPGTNPYGLGN